MSSETRSEVVEKIREAAWVQKFNKRIEDSRVCRFDETILDEMEVILETANDKARIRTIRQRADLIALQDQNALFTALHSRVGEILATVKQNRAALQEIWDTAEEKVSDSSVYMGLKNDKARRLFVSAIFKELFTKIALADRIIVAGEEAKEVLTQRHFAIKAQTELGLEYLKDRQF